jgi:GNAT superfamily N-acetyltransferase
MYQETIVTKHLELHHIPVDGLIELFEEKNDSKAIAGRHLINTDRVLIDNPGPLGWRVPQVKEDPLVNKWFVRFIVEKSSQEIVGSTSFHGAPDGDGMIEIGLGIEERFRNQGYGKESLLGMWRWACSSPEVKILRYTVSPDNLPSIAVINHFGFTYKGQQVDEIDGPENIYETSAIDFMEKWGSQS